MCVCFVSHALAQGLEERFPSAVPLQAEQLPVVSHTQPAPPPVPFRVEGVQVVLDETEGFNRDAALILAVRKALPLALGQLTPPMPMAEAERKAAAIGNPLTFVQRYTLVREVLVPAYNLTVDIQFDAARLQSNFGQTVSATQPAELEPTDAAFPTDNGTLVVPNGLDQTVRVEAEGAASQHRVFKLLNEAGMKPQWRTLTRNGGTLRLITTLEAEALATKLQEAGLLVEQGFDGLVVQ